MLNAPSDRRNSIIVDRRAFPRVAVGDSGQIMERRRRGRRKVRAGEMERIGTSVLVDTFNVLCAQARRDGIDLAEHVRRVLEREASRDNSPVTNRQPA